MMISLMNKDHWSAVSAIYQAGIDTGHATFEASAPASWDAWQQHRLNELSLVALEGGVVRGWASLASASDRCVYAGVAEVSVYVAPQAQGRGVGRQLLGALIEHSEAKNIWTLQAGIFPENLASVALHQALGFETVGLRRRLGKMRHGPLAGRWRDVLSLERRSSRVGIG
jgi:L-amino acid N-acyltransferase YncA